MRYYLPFLTFILPIAFFQVVFGSFNFLFLLVLVSSFFFSQGRALGFAFLAGLALDLFSGGRLGLSSLGFLLPVFLLLVYRQRFSFQNPFIILGMSLVSYFLFSFTAGKTFNVFEGLILAACLLVLRFLAPFLFEQKEQEGRLKL